MAKRTTKPAPKATTRKAAAPKKAEDKQKPSDDAVSETGRVQEERFAAAYVALGSKGAEDAAAKIGLARSYGKVLLKRDSVKKLIAQNIQWQMKNTQMNGLLVLSEMCAVALSDITEIAEFRSGSIVLKDISQIPEHARRAIKKITFKKKFPKPDPNGLGGLEPDVEVTLEMHDKVGACNSLLKHLGIEKPVVGDNAADDKKFTWFDIMNMAKAKPG